MYYQTVLAKSREEVTEHFGTGFYNPEFYQPYYNNTGDNEYLYIIPQDSSDTIFPAGRDLTSELALKKPSGFGSLPVSSEDFVDNGLCERIIRSQRCLIVADGFFIPHHFEGRDQPYFCFIPDGSKVQDRQLFCFAGLYILNGEGNYNAGILSTEANEFFAAVDNLNKRMPLVLDAGLESEWLQDLDQDRVIEVMQRGFTTDPFDAYPVSGKLLEPDANCDFPEILEPVPPIDTRPLL